MHAFDLVGPSRVSVMTGMLMGLQCCFPYLFIFDLAILGMLAANIHPIHFLTFRQMNRNLKCQKASAVIGW